MCIRDSSVTGGFPNNDPDYSTTITLEEEQWNVLDLGWEFSGDFLIAAEVSTTVGVAIDADAAPGQNSWANLGGWQPWTDVANEYTLTDGEFGINANVTTVGGMIPTFNVYRSVGGSEPILMFNGSNLDDNSYTDNTVQNGNEYCYGVTSVYDDVESNLAGPVCAMPEAQTIYELAHDDGTSETSINAGNANYLAVRFTPNAYPVDLYRISYWCVGNANGVGFINIWDDDGVDGSPGTLLMENLATTFSGGIWTSVNMSDYSVNISEGSFYVGWWETPNTPPICVDSDNSSYNSFIDIGAGLGFENLGNYFEGAMMIRAEVDSANVMASNGDESSAIPYAFDLKQNYPNPFNPTTQIKYDLPESANVTINIYDVLGRNISTLVNGLQNAGYHSLRWDAKNNIGESVSAGMYIYTIQAGEYRATKKMVLLK